MPSPINPDNWEALTKIQTYFPDDEVSQTQGPAEQPETSKVVKIKRIALAIGLVAICLPIALLLLESALMYCFQSSISHNYYLPLSGELFVGSLCAIGLLLFVYSGKSKKEDWASSLIGLFAITTALFPTGSHGCSPST